MSEEAPDMAYAQMLTCLSFADWQIILDHLQRGAYREVAHVIDEVSRQITPQIKAHTAMLQAEKSEAPVGQARVN